MTTTSDIRTTAKIKVIGIGGAGCDMITRMIQNRISGAEFIAIDTDKTTLPLTGAKRQILLYKPDTQGIRTESDISLGSKAARASSYEIEAAITGADIVFLITGLGGGTGTGASPYIAEMARRSKALTIAIVTRPFGFEGRYRTRIAAEGLDEIMKKADAVVTIDDERLLELHPEMKINEAFKTINETINGYVSSITDLLTSPGLINLELANIESVMRNAGPVWLSSGKGTGNNRAMEAANKLISDQRSGINIKDARKILLSFTGGNDLALKEVERAVEIIRKAVDPAADIAFGVIIKQQMSDEISLTLIASEFAGLNDSEQILKRLASSGSRQEKPSESAKTYCLV